MATNNKFNRFHRRNEQTKEVNKSILIVCEGERTEPNYFKCFKTYSLDVEAVGIGFNTLSLVQETIKYRDKSKTDFDEVWCVFDKDSFPNQDFDNACAKAASNNISVAYSNEAFELWYLLHFEYINTGINRKQYISKLEKIFQSNFKRSYKKNDEEVYKLLLPYQQVAIRNSKKLSATQSSITSKASRKPDTEVFKLVEQLNKYSRK